MKPATFAKSSLALFLALFIGMGTLMAIEPSPACAEKMHKKLKESIQYPSQAARLAIQGEVQVIFTLNPDGKVTVCHIYGTDETLITYVREKLSGMQCREMKDAFQKYFKVKFNFQLV